MAEFTEYDGGGVMPNTVHPKGKDALTNGDKLRLMSTTGQMEDSQAAVDPGFWVGNEYFDTTKPAYTYNDQAARLRQRNADQAARYKQTPRY